MRNFKLLCCTLVFTILLFSCDQEPNVALTFESKPVADYEHDVVSEWNTVLLAVEKNAFGYRPGPATRALAYLGLSAYEIAIPGMPQYNSFSGKWPGFDIPKIDQRKEYCWPLAINASFEYLMPKFFSQASAEDLDLIRKTAQSLQDKYAETVSAKVAADSKVWGLAVAEAVWDFSKTDEIGHEYYLNPSQGYDWQQYFKKDGDWKPELPIRQATGGIWGKARTFAIAESDKLCRRPETYVGTNGKYTQYLEVFAQVSPVFAHDIQYASFWGDDFVGYTFGYGLRFLSIGNQVLNAQNANLSKAVFMNAILGTALNDASVACFHSKYHYNMEHPLTYIKREIDPTWETNLYNPITKEKNLTPPYPSYPSSHATIAAAGAEALGIVFGYSYKFTDQSHIDKPEIYPGRVYLSFYEAALDASWSRIPLGVNIRMDVEEGVRFGSEIGRSAGILSWEKK